MNMCTKCHGNLSSSDQDIELKSKNVNLLKAPRNKVQKHQTQQKFMKGAREFHSALPIYGQAATASVAPACLHKNLQPYNGPSHLWPHQASFKALTDHIVQKCSIHSILTAITIPSVPKLFISLPSSSQPLGLVCGLKVRQVVISSRKPLSRDCWHLTMTHKHSCNPPHLQTLVI